MSDPSVFSLKRELDALQERIAELERQMKVVWPPYMPQDEEERAKQEQEWETAQAERLRVNRWWVTYNAALQSNAISDPKPHLIDAVHDACVAAADRAHGGL